MPPNIELYQPELTRQSLRSMCGYGESSDAAFGIDQKIPLLNLSFRLESAANWCWFEWQVEQQFSPISTALAFMVTRSLSLLGCSYGDAFTRGWHDRGSLDCAILSGHLPTMRQAAEAALPADSTTPEQQYEQAWSGILRARILGDAEEERSQLALLESYKTSRIGATPSRALLRSFVNRDYNAVQKAVASGAERYWSPPLLPRGIVNKATRYRIVRQESEDQILLDLRFKDGHFFWPRVEAVFAKLAILDGAEITYDSFWFPLAFIKAMRE